MKYMTLADLQADVSNIIAYIKANMLDYAAFIVKNGRFEHATTCDDVNAAQVVVWDNGTVDLWLD